MDESHTDFNNIKKETIIKPNNMINKNGIVDLQTVQNEFWFSRKMQWV